MNELFHNNVQVVFYVVMFKQLYCILCIIINLKISPAFLKASPFVVNKLVGKICTNVIGDGEKIKITYCGFGHSWNI